MSIVNHGDFPLPAGGHGLTGSDMVDRLNRWWAAAQSCDANPTRPDYLGVGGIWTKQDGNTLSIHMWDGTTDQELFKIIAGVPHTTGVDVTTLATKADVLAGHLDRYTKVEVDKIVADAVAAALVTVRAEAAVAATAVTTKLGGYLPLTGGNLTGPLHVAGTIIATADITANA